jgi:hypothetical protein
VCCITGQVDVWMLRICLIVWVDVKCPVFTVFAAWEIIVFKNNTIKGLISGTLGTKHLLDIVIF